MVRRTFPAIPMFGLALAFATNAALAGTVTVITTFPKELTAAYKSAFEKANPGITLEIFNKNTVAGIAFVRETAAGQRPEVFWASAPDAFEVLKRDKLLLAAPEVDNKANGGLLEMSERLVELHGVMTTTKYRHHWQDKIGRLRKRWDNAPHHPEVPTFPDHLHDGAEEQVVDHAAVTGFEVLQYVLAEIDI